MSFKTTFALPSMIFITMWLRYSMYGHRKHSEELNKPNPNRMDFLRDTSHKLFDIDGLNNLK